MNECISLHFGQAGVKLGETCWKLYCLEHGIQPDGKLSSGRTSGGDKSFGTFFKEAEDGNYVPRAIFADLEPTAINEVRTGVCHKIFSPEQFLTSKEDSSHVCTRFLIDRDIFGNVEEEIRKTAEECMNMQGFLIYNSLGGGTGSGLSAHFAEHLSDHYCKKPKIQFAIFPAERLGTSVVEPYNAMISVHRTAEHFDCSFMFDNDCIFDICERHFNIERPNYTNLNNLIAQILSTMTAPLRFDSYMNVNLSTFQANLVPYPRFHFPIVAFAPFISAKKFIREKLSVDNITKACFNPGNQMLRCDLGSGKYMACWILYRGDVVPNDVNNAIAAIKSQQSRQFVEWCPDGVKGGAQYNRMTALPGGHMAAGRRAACLMTNSTAISNVWYHLLEMFDRMYTKQAFLHHYLNECWSENHFHSAKRGMTDLLSDYAAVVEDAGGIND